MSVVKVYCSQCGQRVAGDESFLGTVVHCPVCDSEIRFPSSPKEAPGSGVPAASSSPESDGKPASVSVAIPPPPQIQGAAVPATGPSELPKPGRLSAGGVTTPMPRHPNFRPIPGPPVPPGALPSGAPPSAASVPPEGPASEKPSLERSGLPVYSVPQAPPGGPVAPPVERKDGEEETGDPGLMPLLVLVSGIASLFLFWCFLIPSASAVAIVTGHATLMKLDAAGIKAGRGKVLAGLALGYASAVLFLVVAVVVRLFFWEPIREALLGG